MLKCSKCEAEIKEGDWAEITSKGVKYEFNWCFYCDGVTLWKKEDRTREVSANVRMSSV